MQGTNEAAHKAPQFRKEWDRFHEMTDEIEPQFYEVCEIHGR